MTDTRYGDTDLSLLIRRARGGDPAAFQALAAAYRDRMYRWALVRTGDGDDAEDAAQEALVRLHRGLRKYRGRSSFESWLYAVVRSAAEDVRRRGERVTRLRDRLEAHGSQGVAAEPAPVVERLEARRMSRRVREFLLELPERQREAVDLVDVQDVGHAEAARRMRIREATLRTHLLRGRRTLRCRLLRERPGPEPAE